MTKKILIGFVALLEIFTVQLWMHCNDFVSHIHFSSFDTKLRMLADISNDKGYSVYAVRIFHNKVFATLNDVFNEYLAFWNIHFLALFFSLVGLFGILCGFWYLLTSTKRKRFTWSITTILLLLPFIEIFKIPLPFWLQISMLWIPYALISLYGIWHFLQRKKKGGAVITISLILLSIWYIFAFQQDIFGLFCYNK